MSSDNPSPHPDRGRDLAGIALAVVAVLLLLVGSLAWWARTTLYDTGVITANASEIAAAEDVQAAASALLVDRVVEPALAQGYDAVPAGLGGLLQGLAGSQIEDLATSGVDKAVASQQAHDITVRLATAVQHQLVDGDGPVAFSPSEMAAIVAPNLAENRVVSSIVSFADSTDCCRVVLAERDQLPFVWQHVELIRAAAIVLPIVALVLAVVALLVSSRRRRTALVLSIGVLLAGAATLVGVAVGGSLGIDAVADPSDPSHELVHQAASTIYSVSKRELVDQAWVITAIGAAASVVLLAWIALGARRHPVPASPDGAVG
ncbi:MAG: hypothetical protein ACXWBN_06275 [Acidimicrobiales bacterium]